MKYKFHENIKQRAKGFPFVVIFSCKDYEGYLTVISHNPVGMPEFVVDHPSFIDFQHLAEIEYQLDIYLTGE